jgi:hypothetical protein
MILSIQGTGEAAAQVLALDCMATRGTNNHPQLGL